MRALVVSDLHFGAWTGDDVLAYPHARERLAPHLDGVDELVLLGDVWDLLFSTFEHAFARAEPFFALVRERLQGRRVVWLAGNHDHHAIVRDAEDQARARLLGEPLQPSWLQRYLEDRLPGVECSIAYPAHRVGDVLCCHGHYLDVHVAGSVASRLLSRGLWEVAGGRPEGQLDVDDYESSMVPLTELLHTVAQLPRGTSAQQQVLAEVQRLGHVLGAVSAPEHEARRAFDHVMRRLHGEHPPFEDEAAGVARSTGGTDPLERALRAYAEVVRMLGWDRECERFVFAHTHQPLDGAQVAGFRGRYWNTGCWIYEPTLGTPDAYARYEERSWPGTAVLIDTEAPAPRLLRLLEDGRVPYAQARRLGPMTAPPSLGRA